jgi:hypothetical protein
VTLWLGGRVGALGKFRHSLAVGPAIYAMNWVLFNGFMLIVFDFNIPDLGLRTGIDIIAVSLGYLLAALLMANKLLRQGTLLWFGIAFICFLVAVFDDGFLYPHIGEIAVPISGVAMCFAIFALARIVLPKLAETTTKGYWLLGFLWLAMTILFECAEGVFLEQSTWLEILSAYNPFTGNLWLLVVLTVFFSPRIVAQMELNKEK